MGVRDSHENRVVYLCHIFYCVGALRTLRKQLTTLPLLFHILFFSRSPTILLNLADSINMSFTVFYKKNGVEKPIKLSFLDALRGVPDLKPQKPKSVSQKFSAQPAAFLHSRCDHHHVLTIPVLLLWQKSWKAVAAKSEERQEEGRIIQER
jgi:hypothetical protein